MSYIFLIYSCKQNIVQSTLLYHLIAPRLQTCKTFILSGNPDLNVPYQIIEDKHLIIKCNDNYENLNEKTITAFSIIHEIFPDCKGVFKCDDDIFPNIHKIMEIIDIIDNNYIDYLGRKCTSDNETLSESHYNKCSSDIYNTPKKCKKTSYAAGPFYYVSTSTISSLTSAFLKGMIDFNDTFFEDNMIGFILEKTNHTLYDYNTYYDDEGYHKGCMHNKNHCKFVFLKILPNLEKIENTKIFVDTTYEKICQTNKLFIIVYDDSIISQSKMSEIFGFFNFITFAEYEILCIDLNVIHTTYDNFDRLSNNNHLCILQQNDPFL